MTVAAVIIIVLVLGGLAVLLQQVEHGRGNARVDAADWKHEAEMRAGERDDFARQLRREAAAHLDQVNRLNQVIAQRRASGAKEEKREDEEALADSDAAAAQLNDIVSDAAPEGAAADHRGADAPVPVVDATTVRAVPVPRKV